MTSMQRRHTPRVKLGHTLAGIILCFAIGCDHREESITADAMPIANCIVFPIPITVSKEHSSMYTNPTFGILIEQVRADGRDVVKQRLHGDFCFLADAVNERRAYNHIYQMVLTPQVDDDGRMTTTLDLLCAEHIRDTGYDLNSYQIPEDVHHIELTYRARYPDGRVSEQRYLRIRTIRESVSSPNPLAGREPSS